MSNSDACLKPLGDRTASEAVSCLGDGFSSIFFTAKNAWLHVLNSPSQANMNEWSIVIFSILIWYFIVKD